MREGQNDYLSGYFSTVGYIEGMSASQMERRFGFHTGRLGLGYKIVALAAGVRLEPKDFELRGSTRWSEGKVGAKGTDLKERVDLKNILEARGLHGGQLEAIKRKVCDWFIASPRNRPAKIVPVMAHEDWMEYPDALAIEPMDSNDRLGVPQFKLNKQIDGVIWRLVGPVAPTGRR